MGVMQGDLFVYFHGQCAFESGDLGSPNVVVLLGGLGDGFMTIPYTEALSERLKAESVSFVQVLMESSYSGYGLSSLQVDMVAISLLVKHLKEQRGKQKVVLLGHSTGCQDIMWLNSKWAFSEVASVVVGGILQAPVSDREYAEATMEYSMNELLEWAQTVDPSTVHPTEDPPITASRIKALYERGGEDDFFSTDLSLVERRTKLPFSHIPLMVVFSEEDEYFPYQGKRTQFLKDLEEAWPQIVDTKLLMGADHGLCHPAAQQEFFNAIMSFIRNNKLFW